MTDQWESGKIHLEKRFVLKSLNQLWVQGFLSVMLRMQLKQTGLSSRLCRLFLIFLPSLPAGCPCYAKQDFLETIPTNNWAINILFNLNENLCINVIHVTKSVLSQAIPEGTFSCGRHFLNTGKEPSEPRGKELQALIISNDAPRNHWVKRN